MGKKLLTLIFDRVVAGGAVLFTVGFVAALLLELSSKYLAFFSILWCFVMIGSLSILCHLWEL